MSPAKLQCSKFKKKKNADEYCRIWRSDTDWWNYFSLYVHTAYSRNVFNWKLFSASQIKKSMEKVQEACKSHNCNMEIFCPLQNSCLLMFLHNSREIRLGISTADEEQLEEWILFSSHHLHACWHTLTKVWMFCKQWQHATQTLISQCGTIGDWVHVTTKT